MSTDISEWIKDIRKDEDLIAFADKCELYFDEKIKVIQMLDAEITAYNNSMDSSIKRKWLSFKVNLFLFVGMTWLFLIAVEDLLYGIKLILCGK